MLTTQPAGFKPVLNQKLVKSDHEQGEVEKFFFEENFFKLTGALAHHVRLV